MKLEEYKEFVQIASNAFCKGFDEKKKLAYFALGLGGEYIELQNELDELEYFLKRKDLRQVRTVMDYIELEMGDVLWYSTAILTLPFSARLILVDPFDYDKTHEFSTKTMHANARLLRKQIGKTQELSKKYVYHDNAIDLMRLTDGVKGVIDALGELRWVLGLSWDAITEKNINKLVGKHKAAFIGTKFE